MTNNVSGVVEDGKIHSIHHHLLEVTFETATVLGLRDKSFYTTPSGWWWWWWWCVVVVVVVVYIDSVFREEDPVCIEKATRPGGLAFFHGSQPIVPLAARQTLQARITDQESARP